MVNKLQRNSLPISLSVDHFFFFVFVIYDAENDDSHAYEIEKRSEMLFFAQPHGIRFVMKS